MNGMYPFGQQPRTSPVVPNYQTRMNGYPPSMSDGRILFVNSYEDVRRTPLPVDGSITLFMIAGESIFYTAYMQGNMPLVSGYSFTPLGEQTSNTPSKEETLESRLAKLENFQKEIMDMLGGNSNESNTSATNQPKQRK